MALKNINTLQKLAYTGTNVDLQTYSDVYLKQSLSNLGQRFSAKGDGVTVSSFGVYELFKTLPAPEDEMFEEGGILHNAYIKGTVENKDEHVNIYLTSYNVGGYDDKTIALTQQDYYINDEPIYMTGTKVKSVMSSTNIAYYGEDGIINKRADDYCTAFVCQDYLQEDLEICLENFDKENPAKMLSGVKIYQYNELEVQMTVLTYLGEIDHKDAYDVHQYKFIPEYSTLESVKEIIFDKFAGYIYTNLNDWDPSGLVEAFVEDETILDVSDISHCMAYYNVNTSNVECDSDSFADAFGIGTPIGHAVESAVQGFNEDVVLFVPFVKQYYNEEAYFSTSNNLLLKSAIIAKLLNALYNQFIADSDHDNKLDYTFEAFMPYEYSIAVTCNSNDQAQIFGSEKSLTVEAHPVPASEIYRFVGKESAAAREQVIIVTSEDDSVSTENVFSMWDFYISYDKDSIIDEIVFYRKYILPYINDHGYWTINGVETSIYARGKDGGQPSLIISYTDAALQGDSKYEILSTMNRDELTTAIEWNPVEYRVRPLDTSTIVGNANYHMMMSYMPTNIESLNPNLISFLENAIIMNINSVHSEIVEESTATTPLAYLGQLGPDATITTFWALEKDKFTGEYNFSYVKQPDTSWALDFNYLTDAEAIIKYYMNMGIEPDLYHHSWLVFDGVTNSLKNQGSNRNYIAYPVIMNRTASSFIDMFNIEDETMEEYRYQNNLNLVPWFSTAVQHSSAYISEVEINQDMKYFHLNEDGTLVHDEQDPFDYPVAQALAYPSLGAEGVCQEWYPNALNSNIDEYITTLLPMLDLKEIFVRNINTFNRYNLLSVDEAGKVFYSYMGTTFNEPDKSIFMLGTGYMNINLGLGSLTTEDDRKRFNPQPEIDINFDEIVLNGNVVLPKSCWQVYREPADTRNRIYSMSWEGAYIGQMPPVVDTLFDGLSYPYFRMCECLSESTDDIGEGNYVEEKNAYISYLNVNWFINDVLTLRGFTSDALMNHKSYMIGDQHKLAYLLNVDDVPSYVLRLTTRLEDSSSLLYENSNKYYIKTNPIEFAYLLRPNGEQRINIKEVITSNSTVNELYDGGDL